MRIASMAASRSVSVSAMPGRARWQHTLNRLRQTTRFALNGLAVLLHARRLVHHTIGEVACGRTNHRHGRAQLVRHGSDEFDLLPRQSIGAACRDDDEADGCTKQCENP
jgi:hypothetical protein